VQLKTIFSSRSHNDPGCSCATFDAVAKLNESTNNNAQLALLTSPLTLDADYSTLHQFLDHA